MWALPSNVHMRLRVIDDRMNRRVLGNIEADKRCTQPDRYIHPRDVGRYHDQCGARSGSPQ